MNVCLRHCTFLARVCFSIREPNVFRIVAIFNSSILMQCSNNMLLCDLEITAEKRR